MDVAVVGPPLPDPLPHLRQAVRALLFSAPAFRDLPPDARNALAAAMVRVGRSALELVREEVHTDREARAAGGKVSPLAAAQSAGSEFSGVAAQKVAGVTRDILNAVSFPRFVTELVNGVFKALVDSSIQQMNAYVELLNSVAAATDGFADSNVGAARARGWLIEKYPGSYEWDDEPSDDPEETAERKVRARSSGQPPSPEALRADLGLGPDETVPTGDPESVLVPFARRRLAKTRQEMLSTMVMLGMQRIVIEKGKISAQMKFHVDTKSAAQEDHGSTFDLKNEVSGSGSFGLGPWGASASIKNTIGYVTTEKVQTTEEMKTSLDLNSSVEIEFKSDYLPLNYLATPDQAKRIQANSRNPDAAPAVAGKPVSPPPPPAPAPTKAAPAAGKAADSKAAPSKAAPADSKGTQSKAAPSKNPPAPVRT